MSARSFARVLALSLAAFALASGGGGGGSDSGGNNPPPPPPGGEFSLSVSISGSGSVSSSPAGIDCGSDCSQSYSSGASVTLTATAGAGFIFSGWGGACSGSGTCTVTMSEQRNVSATFRTATATANLCEGLVTDKQNHPLSQNAVQKPAARQSFVDPQFRTTIRRVTDHNEIGKSYVKTMYSTIPAWSKEEKWLLLLASGFEHVLYDGATYAFVRNISGEINPSDGEQVLWSQKDPDVLYYADRTTREFYSYDVAIRTRTRLHDFKTAPTSCTDDLTLGSDPMYGSWDGTKVGLTCQQKNWVYDFSSNRVYAVRSEQTQSNNPQTAYIVAPSGTKVFLSFQESTAQVRDLDGNVLRTISDLTPHEHASLGKYANGDDAFFGVQFDRHPGLIVGANLDTGVIKVHVGPNSGWPYPPSGSHVSALSIDNPGWVVASAIGDTPLGQSVLENELVLTNIDTADTCRIGHHRSRAADYFSEPHPVPSPSGTRIAFSSDWFGTDGADVYVVELPSYRP